jgi:PAS domain S-box-containing protein
MTRRGMLRRLRWSALPLRTKGLIVVLLPVLPAAFFCLVLGVALLRAPVAGAARPARSLTPAQQQATRRVQLVILAASIICTAGGVAAALVLGAGLRRRVDMLVDHADRIGRQEIPEDLPTGHDEIGRVGARLRAAGQLLHDREQALRRSTYLLDQFFNLSHDLFAIAGLDGRFRRLNPAWERTLGYTTDELMARPFAEFVHPDDRERTAREVEALAGGEQTISFENRYRRKDGEYRWLLWAARAAPADEVIYASARDITDERDALARHAALNLALRQQAAQLESANRELEAFSYSVSHDLRAPLRAIDGFSQAIEEDEADRLTDGGRDSLQRVRAAAQRMAILIDDMLNLSRLSRMDMLREPVNLSEIAETIAAELRRRAPERPLTIAIAPGLQTVGDARMLRIALHNLLENAWKYTGRTPHAHIELFGEAGTNGIPVFRVRDNGAGFDMKYVHKLFGAFQRLHAERDFDGTGIGLATVQRVITRHGGQVWAEGAVNQGATFSFSLEGEGPPT